MIRYTIAETVEDLHGILALQKANLSVNLTQEEILKEGFVTAVHSFENLKKMNDLEQSIIAKNGDEVIAYLLAMTPECKNDIAALISLFENFEKLEWKGKLISRYHYIVVGQVCVAKGYRGLGILDNCYYLYKERFKSKYDFAITDIDIKNQRSINAHKRIGFQEILRFTAANQQEWSIVIWEW